MYKLLLVKNFVEQLTKHILKKINSKLSTSVSYKLSPSGSERDWKLCNCALEIFKKKRYIHSQQFTH